MQINLKYINLINSAWLSRDLLIKLKFGGNAQAAVAGTWEEQGDTAQMCSNGIMKANVQWEQGMQRILKRVSLGTLARKGSLKRA